VNLLLCLINITQITVPSLALTIETKLNYSFIIRRISWNNEEVNSIISKVISDDSKAPNAGNVVRTTPILMSPFVRVEDKP